MTPWAGIATGGGPTTPWAGIAEGGGPTTPCQMTAGLRITRVMARMTPGPTTTGATARTTTARTTTVVATAAVAGVAAATTTERAANVNGGWVGVGSAAAAAMEGGVVSWV
jgi:hypothetical protein